MKTINTKSVIYSLIPFLPVSVALLLSYPFNTTFRDTIYYAFLGLSIYHLAFTILGLIVVVNRKIRGGRPKLLLNLTVAFLRLLFVNLVAAGAVIAIQYNILPLAILMISVYLTEQYMLMRLFSKRARELF